MKSFPNSSQSSRAGITLVEVMFSIAILALLAIFSTTSLFYPHLLVVSGNHEQSAINAANSALERYLHNQSDPVEAGVFAIDGQPVTIFVEEPKIVSDNGSDVTTSFLKITATVQFYNDQELTLTTYRTREVASNER